MTTTSKEMFKCAICGERSEHMVVDSTNTFGGSMDLDTRPPEMKRSTINMWVKVCPSCGYCSTDISKCSENSPEIVHSLVYQQQLKNPQFPELANAFLCASLIKEIAGQYAEAGWDSIHSAWACDDAGSDVGAHKCREKAVILLEKAKEKGQEFAASDGGSQALMVDLLRRSEQFEMALKLCYKGLSNSKTEAIVLDILRFQKTLVFNMDIACHKISESSSSDL